MNPTDPKQIEIDIALDPTDPKRLEIDISERDLTLAVAVLRGLTFSQIQTTVPQWDVDAAYLSQESLIRLREQLELRLGAIEFARSLLEHD